MRLTLLLLVPTALTGCELADRLDPDLAVRPHPCFGNRTDTVFIDDADTMYVGCGTTTEGQGLYRTTDAGRSWEPVAGFEAFRVSHVHRAGDGVLYVAGTGPNSQRVVSLGIDDTITPVFEAQAQTWNSFHVGTFLRMDDGSAMAESLTGGDLAFRPTETGPWEDGYGWWTGEDSFQVLDAVLFDGHVVGVGSTIIQPPTVFVQQEGPGFTMSDTSLLDTIGELWSVDTDGRALVAGGVDQSADVGLIFWTDGGDPSDPASWESTDLRDLSTDQATWVRGVCRDGDHLVAVGEYSQLGEGLMLESTDGGISWNDITPDSAPPLSRCRFGHGRLAIAGAQGFFALN
ncbi:MAG: hypothetical protein R3F61_06610 [Myxococcota bacterium]